MKRIELLVTKCTIQEQELDLDYRLHLMGLLETPPGGANIIEQRRICRVHDALIAAAGKEIVLLEDADHETLCGILKETKFKVYSKPILEMLESVLEAPNAEDVKL